MWTREDGSIVHDAVSLRSANLYYPNGEPTDIDPDYHWEHESKGSYVLIWAVKTEKGVNHGT